jgi:hypothetical protein
MEKTTIAKRFESILIQSIKSGDITITESLDILSELKNAIINEMAIKVCLNE